MAVLSGKNPPCTLEPPSTWCPGPYGKHYGLNSGGQLDMLTDGVLSPE